MKTWDIHSSRKCMQWYNMREKRKLFTKKRNSSGSKFYTIINDNNITSISRAFFSLSARNILEIIRNENKKCATHWQNNNEENETKKMYFPKRRDRKKNIRNRMRFMKCSNNKKKKDFVFCYWITVSKVFKMIQ